MSEYIALGLPDDINLALERECRTTGIPKSMLILDKLRQAYGISKSDSTDLHRRIAQLESQILVLTQQVRLLKDPRLNIENSIQAAPIPSTERSDSANSSSPDPQSPDSEIPDDDDWADEPDEVLYDFLEPGQDLPY